MGDENKRSRGRQRTQILGHKVFRLGVEIRGDLVQNEHTRAPNKRTGECDPLPLTTRHTTAKFANHGI